MTKIKINESYRNIFFKTNKIDKSPQLLKPKVWKSKI